MLISFSVENFRSIRKRQTLYLSAVKTCKEWREENVAEECGRQVLRSAVIYGANASGKTNFLLALERMRMFMLTSSDIDKSAHNLSYEPFLLETGSLLAPETFEVQFSLDGKVYSYGFSIQTMDGNPYQYEVVREWLIENVKKREVVYFLRERRRDETGEVQNVISVSDSQMPQGAGLEPRTRPDALFFTVAAQFAEPTCLKISEYFKTSVNIVSGVNHTTLSGFTRNLLVTNPSVGDKIRQMIRNADTGICDVQVAPDGSLVSVHEQRDVEGRVQARVPFNFAIAESHGTKKIFDLSGGIIDTLSQGRILVVDELDAKLHPTLVRRLVMLFNDSKSNPKNAQLVVNVQSPDLLSYKVFYPPRKRAIVRLRRDQFYFVEKGEDEASRLVSLVEFKDEQGKAMRNDASFAKAYMSGQYGGIPFVKDLLASGG